MTTSRDGGSPDPPLKTCFPGGASCAGKLSSSSPNPPVAREVIGVLTAVGAGLCLTLGGLFVSLVVHVPALTVSGVRSTFAVFYLLPFLLYFRPQLVPKSGRLELAGVSVIFAFKFLTFTLGSVKLPLAEFSLLLNTTPLFAALLSCLFLREPCGSRETVGGAIVLAGVTIVFLPSLLIQQFTPLEPPTPFISTPAPILTSRLTTLPVTLSTLPLTTRVTSPPASPSQLTTLPVTTTPSSLTTKNATSKPLSTTTGRSTVTAPRTNTSTTPQPQGNVTSAPQTHSNVTSHPLPQTTKLPPSTNDTAVRNTNISLVQTSKLSPLLASLAAKSSMTSATGISLTLLSSIANAVVLVWLRRLCDISPLVIAFWASLTTTIMCLPIALILGQLGTWDVLSDVLYIALAGATCLLSSYLPAVACSLTHAGRVAIAMTSGVIFSFALQAIVQMVAPTPWSLVGGGFIVAAVIITNVDVSEITARCDKRVCDDSAADHSPLRDNVKQEYGAVSVDRGSNVKGF
ncbi:uncharacterized protein LOC135369906 isoform X2 [Ornithodoros turicata]|uniref:uncharacterized protein LOC135369906 isoform X2 n=1 Tax=Ornithodoros turicata TaxID=34597 RepID=UPI0031394262